MVTSRAACEGEAAFSRDFCHFRRFSSGRMLMSLKRSVDSFWPCLRLACCWFAALAFAEAYQERRIRSRQRQNTKLG